MCMKNMEHFFSMFFIMKLSWAFANSNKCINLLDSITRAQKKIYWLFSIWYEWYSSRWIDITGWVASSSALINVTISINVLWKVLFVSDIFHWMHYQIVNRIMKSDTTEDSIDILNGFEPASIPFAHVSTSSIQKWTVFLWFHVRCSFFMSYLPSFSFLVINSLIFQQPNEIEMNSSWVPERNGHC